MAVNIFTVDYHSIIIIHIATGRYVEIYGFLSCLQVISKFPQVNKVLVVNLDAYQVSEQEGEIQ